MTDLPLNNNGKMDWEKICFAAKNSNRFDNGASLMRLLKNIHTHGRTQMRNEIVQDIFEKSFQSDKVYIGADYIEAIQELKL